MWFLRPKTQEMHFNLWLVSMCWLKPRENSKALTIMVQDFSDTQDTPKHRSFPFAPASVLHLLLQYNLLHVNICARHIQTLDFHGYIYFTSTSRQFSGYLLLMAKILHQSSTSVLRRWHHCLDCSGIMLGKSEPSIFSPMVLQNGDEYHGKICKKSPENTNPRYPLLFDRDPYNGIMIIPTYLGRISTPIYPSGDFFTPPSFAHFWVWLGTIKRMAPWNCGWNRL